MVTVPLVVADPNYSEAVPTCRDLTRCCFFFGGLEQWFPELLKPSYQNVPERAGGDREKRGPAQGPSKKTFFSFIVHLSHN